MAVTQILTTDTLENLRTKINSLALNDFGDPALLTTTATSIVGAVNELAASVSATGFTLRDESSTTQTIASGDVLNIIGSSGITAVVSSTDTLTIALESNIPENLYIDVIGTKYNADASNAYHTIVTTVAAKTSAHIYFGTGSGNGYLLDGIEGPFLNLKVGNTYRFDQSAASNSGHPLRFYYDVNKVTQFSTGVTTSGTPGNAGAYTQIVVSETTPNILYYQCSVHANMGSRSDLDTSNFIDPTFTSTTGSTITYITNTQLATELLPYATRPFAIAQAVALG
jgi:hypothetical protein